MLKSNRCPNKIWSDVVKEESLCETLLKLTAPTADDHNDDEPSTISDQPKRNSRDIESYQYKNPDLDDSKFAHRSTTTTTGQQQQRRRRRRGRGRDNNQRRGEAGSSQQQRSTTPSPVVSELDSDEAVVLAIVKYLREPKTQIIQNCVKILGKKKSLELLQATQDVIENGGLLTSAGNRARTPGGIYIQLMKLDETILNCQRSQIFAQEVVKKKKAKATKKRLQKKPREFVVADEAKSSNQQAKFLVTSDEKNSRIYENDSAICENEIEMI